MSDQVSKYDTGENHRHTDEFTLEEKIKYGIAGIIVLGASFFIGRSIIRKARATGEEKKTFEEGSEATYAKQIKMAFENDNWFGWGTDEEALRKTIQAIPSKDAFRKVIKSYQKLYARSLMADMKNDLSTSEYEEMLAIISTKPEKGNAPIRIAVSQQQCQAWAKRLRAAFNEHTWGFLPYGTDEEAIKSVFMEIPTQSAFSETAKAYMNLYGDDLISDLKSELEFYEWGPMMSIISKKPL
jgi:hypothetical protein